MCRELAYLIAALLVLMAGAAAQAAVWTVDFETPHDFLVNGVEGTGWDGFIGLAPNETVNALNASIARPGQLYLESANAVWSEAWNPLGPFLYKVVEGDFVATVQVTDYAGTPQAVVYHNDCSLAARAFLDDAGPGEDWVSLDYFPIWSCGNFIRSANDNVRTEEYGHNGKQWDLDPWLQIERQGNTFHFRTSQDGVTWAEMAQSPLTRDDLADVPLQVGLRHATFSAEVGYAAFDDFRLEGPNVTPPGKAFRSIPASGATDVPRDQVLSWTRAEAAVSHDVYFGTILEEVTAASRTTPLDVLVGQGQNATTYDPPGVLTFGQTYYWRVDEVEADGTIRAGDVWQFTVEPAYYPIENVTATASTFDPLSGAEKTTAGSGLNADDRHSDRNADMWLIPPGETDPVWIQYEFDQVHKVYDMWIWNSNVQYEIYLGFSVKDATIEYSVDANDWTVLGDYTLNQGTGLPDYAHNTVVSFDGALAKYVRVNVNSNYGGARTGLSEVRFFQSPVAAREPQPASGAINVDPDVVLSWRAGREAASHDVYFGTDEQAVADGSAFADTVTEPSYASASLELGMTYYWKINEVNEAETPTSWEGEVWSLSTPDYFVVEDFENYTGDEDNEVFNTWLDGYGTTTNGSQAGHDNPPYVEQTIVHSGRQSMPLYYNNAAGITTSEVERTFDVPQDWTKAGAATLVLYVRGSLGNAAGQLYVKVNGTRRDCSGSTASLAAPIWKQCNIDLTSLGANSVRTLTIGVSGSGSGLLYVDDIHLYRVAPMAEPAVDPGTASLMALYTMENSMVDVSGHGYDGVAQVGASYGQGPAGFGNALLLDGAGGHADLPIGPLIESLSNCTVALWVNWPGTGGAWQRAFDFGSGTGAYMFLCPSGGGNLRFAITAEGVGESQLNASALPTGWHHVAVAIDGDAAAMQMYLDGMLVDDGTTDTVPAQMGTTTQNWIGRSQYTADAYFDGSVDDLRIYNRVLSEPEVRYLVGDR